jgi:hypothetical protein
MKQGDVTTQGQAAVVPIPYINHFTRDTSLASSTQAVSGVGFKPSAVIFLAAETGDDVSWGFDDGTKQREIHLDVGANVSKTTNRSILLTDGTNSYQGNISSIDTDGFTINWVKGNSPTGIATIMFMAFK